MSTPTLGQVHVNRPLTNLSVAYMQDEMTYIADKIFPRVPVARKSDSYYVYDKEAFMKAIAELRSGATESAGGGWKQSTDNYNCKQKSFHHDVPKDVAENSDEVLDPYRDAVEFVTRAMLIKRETDFVNSYFKPGVWANEITVSANDRWDDYSNSDPYTQVQVGIRAVQKGCLVKPNILLLSPYAFDAAANHPDLKDRYKYTSAESMTTDMLAKIFKVDRVLVAEAVAATNVEGDPTVGDFAFGKHALLVYAAPRPSMLAPSAGYIFTWNAFGNNYGARISRFLMRQLNNSDRVEGDMAYDTKVVCADAAYFFNGVVS